MIMCIKISDWKILHSIEHFYTKLFQKSLRDSRHHLGISDRGQNGQDVKYKKQPYIIENFSGNSIPVSALPACLYDRDDILHENSWNGRDNCTENNTEQYDWHLNRIKLKQCLDQTSQCSFFCSVWSLIFHRHHLPYSEMYILLCKSHCVSEVPHVFRLH